MNLFPYSEIRPEQDKLLESIRDSISKKQHTLVHAPTGLGKTVGALVPALEHALEKNLTVFFLTSRHTQHAIAVETLKAIKEKHGTNFIVTDLVGKKNMCLQDGVFELRGGEFHEYCRKLRDENRCEYYNNTKSGNKNTIKADVLITHIKGLGPIHTEQINDLCKDDKFCPYEVATSLAKDSNVIIADYSYIFKDDIRNSLFRRMSKNLGDCIIVVDEAHNLPRRIIDGATQKLTTFIIKRAIQECNKYEHTETAVKLTSFLEKLGEAAGKEEQLIGKEEFVDLVNQIEPYDKFKEELYSIADAVYEQQKQAFTGAVANFLTNWTGEDFGFTRIISMKDGKVTLAYKCLDASVISKEIIKQSYSTIAMSGTLLPIDMYRDLLGFENAEEKIFASPFPAENKLSLIVPFTTTKFSSRSEEQFENIAKITTAITNTVPGNCVIFFPSYSLRDNVYKYFKEETEKTTFLEVSDMSKQDKTDMLEQFKAYASRGAVLLGATSGNFSEGIDLKGDFLKCVIVVGLPLQQPDLETQEAIKYYDAKFGKGWDYGYVFPAFNKVLQSAGRCIRSETDRGVIVYLDERYAWPNYIRCFPEDLNLKIKKDFIGEIEEFFDV
ncbi:MAG TPA: ATP-dependent DNA helicase [Candidatus Nanoarchaeia archaeon]|nr:ATP-dependent DNA helicase [Candidatus Nanoarchaeia archaeon]